MYESAIYELTREAPYLFTVKTDNSSNNGIEGVIFATTNVYSGVEFGTSLSDKNVACFGLLAAVDLDSQALGNGITTESGRPTGFSMCHNNKCYV